MTTIRPRNAYQSGARPVPATAGQRSLVLVVLCLAVFTINVDTTLVNVTLPTLVRNLGASTRELQWVVDAYNLAFAALVSLPAASATASAVKEHC